MNEDIPILNRHFTALGLNFDLNNSFQYGGLLYLAQHYGYPTPLLDWTLSPFIGAYFAYSGLENNIENNDKVRVFCFDKKNWVSDTPQIRNLISPFPTLTYSELHPFSNNRAMPQQAISTLSHFDDIEKYIKNRADENKKNYLKIYELPSSERNEVIDELHWMGISASSMYPGIEGVCKMLREKYFR